MSQKLALFFACINVRNFYLLCFKMVYFYFEHKDTETQSKTQKNLREYAKNLKETKGLFSVSCI